MRCSLRHSACAPPRCVLKPSLNPPRVNFARDRRLKPRHLRQPRRWPWPAPSRPVPAAPPGPPSVLSKFSTTFYGFVEADFIRDSTQSFNDVAGNGTVARSGSFAANHDRMIFGQRNSRLGFKLKGPETEMIKSSGIAEMDFLGNQPQGSPSPPGSPAVSESAYFASPTFRIRHMALKLETPIVDVLAGQYWELFGWQTIYHPNSVQIQGLPGQVFSRAPQFRLSHMFKTDAVNVEIAVAAVRPPQRDSGLPDGQAGLRLVLNDWKGMRTAGGAGTSVDPLSVGVSGVARRFRLARVRQCPSNQTQNINGYGLSIRRHHPGGSRHRHKLGQRAYRDCFVRAWTGHRGSLHGTHGRCELDHALPADSTGKPSSFAWISTTGWSSSTTRPDARDSLAVGSCGCAVLPPDHAFPYVGFWQLLAHELRRHQEHRHRQATGSNVKSKLFNKSDFADGNLFVDATQSIRFGLEYAWFRQTYLDGTKGTNHRVQFSGFYIF
jgi:hypothetical protein